MPPIPSLSSDLMEYLLAFLTTPELAPPGTAARAGDLAAHTEPSYPPDVTAPPSRYKTGYGTEPYIITPPWSTLTAYDLNSGKIVWQTPYGDVPEAGPSDKLRGNVFPRGGFVVLGGGVILFAGNDSKLYALDEDTGKVICTKDMPNGTVGVPAVYDVDGREYVLFAVLGGGRFPAGAKLRPGGVEAPATSKAYIAFALPE